MKHRVTQKIKLHLEKMGKNHVRVLQYVMENIDGNTMDNMETELGLKSQHVDRIMNDYHDAINNFWEYA
jgi:hypothetical protein